MVKEFDIQRFVKDRRCRHDGKRRFDGKLYELTGCNYTKSMADEYAQVVRGCGENARIVRNEHGRYDVYVRRQPKRRFRRGPANYYSSKHGCYRMR